jgi:hypothetical protein
MMRRKPIHRFLALQDLGRAYLGCQTGSAGLHSLAYDIQSPLQKRFIAAERANSLIQAGGAPFGATSLLKLYVLKGLEVSVCEATDLRKNCQNANSLGMALCG